MIVEEKKETIVNLDAEEIIQSYPGFYYLLEFRKGSVRILSSLFGILPLYYFENDDEILVSSQAGLIRTVTTCFPGELMEQNFNFKTARKRNWKSTDLMLWLEIARYSRIKYLDESTAVYRLRSESASRTPVYKQMHDFYHSVFDVLFFYWEKYNQDSAVKRKLDTYYHLVLLGDAFKMDDTALAEEAWNYSKINKIRIPLKQKTKFWLIKQKKLRKFLYLFKKE
jgi:hypothetical protein